MTIRCVSAQPVRLELTCRREGHAPWTLLYEVDVKPDPASQIR